MVRASFSTVTLPAMRSVPAGVVTVMMTTGHSASSRSTVMSSGVHIRI